MPHEKGGYEYQNSQDNENNQKKHRIRANFRRNSNEIDDNTTCKWLCKEIIINVLPKRKALKFHMLRPKAINSSQTVNVIDVETEEKQGTL